MLMIDIWIKRILLIGTAILILGTSIGMVLTPLKLRHGFMAAITRQAVAEQKRHKEVLYEMGIIKAMLQGVEPHMDYKYDRMVY